MIKKLHYYICFFFCSLCSRNIEKEIATFYHLIRGIEEKKCFTDVREKIVIITRMIKVLLCVVRVVTSIVVQIASSMISLNIRALNTPHNS
jgi:hypothetical protein